MRRLTALWLDPKGAATQAEMVRMVTEKQAAAAEAAFAFSLAMAEETWKFWAGAAMGQVAADPVSPALRRSLRKASRPVSRRVHANRRRLAR